MLEGAKRQDLQGATYLSLEAWDLGTARVGDTTYKHRGSFVTDQSGEPAFLFVVENAKDGSTVTYSGRIGAKGSSVSYKKVAMSAPNATPEVSNGSWSQIAD